MSRNDVELINKWYRRRHGLLVQNGASTLSLLPRKHNAQLDHRDALAFSVTIGEQEILIFFAPEIKGAVAASYGVSHSQQLRGEAAFLLLADRLSSVLDVIERHTGTKIGAIKQAGAQNKPSNGLSLEGIAVSGEETFCFEIAVPDALKYWLAAALSTVPVNPVNSALIPFTANFYIGSVDLTLRQLMSIRLNDVLFADTTPSRSDVLVVFGEKYTARAKLENLQLTLLEYPSTLAHEQSGIGKMVTPPQSAHGIENQDAEFDEIQVKLVFEIGQKQLSVGELRSLEPGHVFDLTRSPRTAVDIYAATRRVGHGEVVEINGTLGVRVTRLFNNE